MFLNITPTVANWTSDNKQFSLIFDENPLADFVELPDDGRAQDELWYSNILCGILRGALEMVCCFRRLHLLQALFTEAHPLLITSIIISVVILICDRPILPVNLSHNKHIWIVPVFIGDRC